MASLLTARCVRTWPCPQRDAGILPINISTESLPYLTSWFQWALVTLPSLQACLAVWFPLGFLGAPSQTLLPLAPHECWCFSALLSMSSPPTARDAQPPQSLFPPCAHALCGPPSLGSLCSASDPRPKGYRSFSFDMVPALQTQCVHNKAHPLPLPRVLLLQSLGLDNGPNIYPVI